MNVLQGVFAAVSLGVSIIFSVMEKIGDHLREARSSVRDELYYAYKEYSNTLNSGAIDTPSLERMKRLHSSYGEDGVKIVLLDWALRKVAKVLYSITLLVVISLLIGNFLDESIFPIWRSFLILYLPVAALLLQGLIVVGATQADQFLKSMKTRYDRKEY